MNEEMSYEEWVEAHMPKWAKEMREVFRMLNAKIFALSLEVDTLRKNEEIFEQNDELFEKWTDEFFVANNLEHLIEPYHDFISAKVDEE